MFIISSSAAEVRHIYREPTIKDYKFSDSKISISQGGGDIGTSSLQSNLIRFELAMKLYGY